MGNIIYSNDFITVSDSLIYARSVSSGYEKANVTDYFHLKRRIRANDLIKNDTGYLMKFDFGSARTIDAIFMNDVNFNKVRFFGHASDLGDDWSTATFNSGDLSISKDIRVNRYKRYSALTSFNYEWLAVQVPAGATAVGSYQDKWEIGTIVILDSVVELSENISFGYIRSSEQKVSEVVALGGSNEQIEINPNLQWTGQINFGNRSSDEETEVWTFNQMNLARPMIFYENLGETQNCYLCIRKTSYQGNYSAYNQFQSNQITLVELV